jgi:radical SAM superfamily enzyme YgiQ (UPF0313 family)
MKLLFLYINPTGRTAIPPNVSMLIGYLRKHSHHTIEVFDTSFYRFDLGKPVIEASWTPGYFLPVKKKKEFPQKESNLYADLEKKIKEFAPDLLAVSSYSNQFKIICDILEHLKDSFPLLRNIVGGPHASFVPAEVIKQPYIDMICVGEGEEPLLELCNGIENREDFSKIINLWFKDGDKVIINPVRAPLALDEIGEPDWGAFDPCHILQPFHGNYFRVGMVEYGRGCPFHCTYCANSCYLEIYKEHKKSYFRHRDPYNFISMLKKLKIKFNLEIIYFQDGTFLTMPDDVLKELAELYQREINRPCIILTTVTTINEKRLEYLNRMRCIYINLGIEAGNPVFREKFLKRKMSNELIINAFKLVRKFKIYSAAYNVIGFPYETRDDIFQTIELNRQCNPDSVYPQIFYPIEGCELKKICVEEGFYDPAKESLYSQIKDTGNVSILDNLPLNREEIHGLLRTFYLYVRMPQKLYPMIQALEEDQPLTRTIITNLTEFYMNREPYFEDLNSLHYSQPKIDRDL